MSDTARSRRASNILRNARQVIATENQWTQGRYARTRAGSPVTHQDPDAVCFCAVGALRRAEPDHTDAREAAARFLFLAVNDGRKPADHIQIPVFNDNPKTEHADVIRAYDRAIALAIEHEKAVAHG